MGIPPGCTSLSGGAEAGEPRWDSLVAPHRSHPPYSSCVPPPIYIIHLMYACLNQQPDRKEPFLKSSEHVSFSGRLSGAALCPSEEQGDTVLRSRWAPSLAQGTVSSPRMPGDFGGHGCISAVIFRSKQAEPQEERGESVLPATARLRRSCAAGSISPRCPGSG